jgi:CRP/FNR family cyclic AMP-dependent transcriptional regulator
LTTAAELDFLRQVTLFKDLGEEDLAALGARLRERRVREGEVLFRQGEPGDEMFLIRRGAVLISKPVIGRAEQVLARLGPGEFFGEMSLFDQAPRSASVQAETETVMLCLDRDSLQHLIRTSPHAAAAFFYRLAEVFIRRLRETGDLVAEVTRWGLEATGLDADYQLPG